MTNDVMFNLSAFSDRLMKERKKLVLAGKIKEAVNARSIQVDLMIALESADALLFSFENPMNQPSHFREARAHPLNSGSARGDVSADM